MKTFIKVFLALFIPIVLVIGSSILISKNRLYYFETKDWISFRKSIKEENSFIKDAAIKCDKQLVTIRFVLKSDVSEDKISKVFESTKAFFLSEPAYTNFMKLYDNRPQRFRYYSFDVLDIQLAYPKNNKTYTYRSESALKRQDDGQYPPTRFSEWHLYINDDK